MSPGIHQGFATRVGIEIVYERKLIEVDGFDAGIRSLIVDGFEGFSVTVPFKEDAFRLADRLSDRAKFAGAVNTLHVKGDEIFGDNTDGAGLVRDLQRKAVVLKDKSILLIGAGGAAKGVMAPLLTAGANVTVVNRTYQKAVDLAKQFELIGETCSCELSDLDAKFDVVINATSAGLTSQSTPWTTGSIQVDADTVCYDLVYSKDHDTLFMQWAKAQGATQVFDGYGMLIEQAKLQFELFNGLVIPA